MSTAGGAGHLEATVLAHGRELTGLRQSLARLEAERRIAAQRAARTVEGAAVSDIHAARASLAAPVPG